MVHIVGQTIIGSEILPILDFASSHNRDFDIKELRYTDFQLNILSVVVATTYTDKYEYMYIIWKIALVDISVGLKNICNLFSEHLRSAATVELTLDHSLKCLCYQSYVVPALVVCLCPHLTCLQRPTVYTQSSGTCEIGLGRRHAILIKRIDITDESIVFCVTGTNSSTVQVRVPVPTDTFKM